MSADMALLAQFEEKVGTLITFGDDIIGIAKRYGNLKSGNAIIEDIVFIERLNTMC